MRTTFISAFALLCLSSISIAGDELEVDTKDFQKASQSDVLEARKVFGNAFVASDGSRMFFGIGQGGNLNGLRISPNTKVLDAGRIYFGGKVVSSTQLVFWSLFPPETKKQIVEFKEGKILVRPANAKADNTADYSLVRDEKVANAQEFLEAYWPPSKLKSPGR